MSVIIRLQNLPWSANALDIRGFFRGLSIPDGGVHIIGGEMGDAFIAFSTDEDARQAMMNDRGKINEVQIRLLLSSRAEMQKVIETARQQSLKMQMQMGGAAAAAASATNAAIAVASPIALSKPAAATGGVTAGMPTPQPPVITANSLQNILSNQLASVAAAAAAAVGHNSKPPSFLAYQQQAGIVVAPQKPVLPAPTTALASAASTQDANTSRDRHRSNSHDRDPRRSYSQDGNGGAGSRRRRDRSRSRSRERDRDSRNKVYRSNRRSRSRDRSRERSRESSRDRSRDRNRNSATNGKENKSKESAGVQNAKLKEATAAGDDLKKMQSNLLAWNMANAYQANYGTQEAMAKASVTDLAAASASTRTLLNQYGSTSSILPSIPILPNAYTTNVVNNMTTAADKITPLAVNTPSMQNYTTASTATNLTSPYNLFSNISGGVGGGDLSKSMFTLQNPYTQQTAAAPSKMATDSKVNANAIKLNPPIAAASTTAASLFGVTTKSADLKDSSTTAAAATSTTTNDFSAAAASVNLAMGANPYASVYPGLFSAMNAAGAYGVTKQQQQQQSQQQQQQSPQRSSGNFSQDFMNNRNSSGSNNNNNSSQGSNNNNSGGGNNNSNSANNEKSFRNYDDQETGNSCIKVSNMCSSTCYSDIRKFFSGLYIPHNGIKMINDKHGLRVGVAYIRFVRPSNVQKALVRNGTMLKSKRVTLEPAPDEEFDKHEDSYHPGKGGRQSRFNQISPNRSVSPVSPSADGSGSSKFDSFASNSFKMRTYGGGQQNENRDERCSSSGAASGGNAQAPISRAASGRKESTDSKMKTTTSSSTAAEPFSVLYIEDIPNFAAEQDIMKMFSSYSIYDILLKQSPGNRRELIAFVKFHRTDDAKAAFDDKSKHLIGNRQVRVNISSEMDFNRVRAKNSRADDDGNGDGNDDDDDNNDEDERERDNNGDRDDDDDVDDDDDDDADNDNNEGSSRNKKRLKRDRGAIGSDADEKTENRNFDGNAMNTLSQYDDNRTMQQQQQQKQNRNQNYDNDRNGGGTELPSLFDSLPDNNFGGNLEKLKNNDPRLRRGKRPSRFDAPRTDNNNLGGGGGGNTNLFGLNNASGNNNNCFGRQQQQQQQLQQHHHHQQQQQHRPNHQQQNHDKELCFVLVKNCEFKTTIQDIGEYFLTKNLNAQHIEMLYNKRQQPCGDFIVEFTNQKDAQYAVMGFNNVRFNSRMMKVIRITPQEIADRLNMPFMNYFPRNRVNNNNGGGGGGGGNNNNSMNRNDFNDGRFMDCGGNGNFGNFNNNNNGNNFNNFRGNHDNFQAPNMGRIGGGVGSSNNFNYRRNNMNNFRRDNNNDDFDDDDDDDCVGGGGGIGVDNDFIDNKISIDDIRNDGGIGPGGIAGSIGGGGSMNDFGSPQSDNKNCNNDDNNGIPDKFNRSGCVLEMENVPYRAELMDIMNFFQGFNIKPDDIIRRFNDDGTATGDARVAFETEAEARAAYEAKRQKSIFNRTIYLNLL